MAGCEAEGATQKLDRRNCDRRSLMPTRAELPLAIAAARRFPIASAGDPKASQALAAIADENKYPLELRIDALSIIVGKRPKLSDSQFDLLAAFTFGRDARHRSLGRG